MVWKWATLTGSAEDFAWTYPSLPNPLNQPTTRRSKSICRWQSIPTLKMAKCPYCDHILEDEWLKKVGATLMGKTGGAAKARPSARAAAKKRWKKARAKEFPT